MIDCGVKMRRMKKNTKKYRSGETIEGVLFHSINICARPVRQKEQRNHLSLRKTLSMLTLSLGRTAAVMDFYTIKFGIRTQ